MFVRHLDHLNLYVADLEATIAWYQRVFGFVVVESGFSRAPFAILRAGDAMLCLYQGEEHRGPGGGFNHFALRIADREVWIRTMAEQNIQVSYGTGEITYPFSSSWYVDDPSGYQIEVVAWKEDRIQFPA